MCTEKRQQRHRLQTGQQRWSRHTVALVSRQCRRLYLHRDCHCPVVAMMASLAPVHTRTHTRTHTRHNRCHTTHENMSHHSQECRTIHENIIPLTKLNQPTLSNHKSTNYSIISYSRVSQMLVTFKLLHCSGSS